MYLLSFYYSKKIRAKIIVDKHLRMNPHHLFYVRHGSVTVVVVSYNWWSWQWISVKRNHDINMYNYKL